MRAGLLFGTICTAMLAVGCAQSDGGITTSVKTQLAADDLVKARRVDVDTRDRVVTLKGEVRSAEEEAKALQIARNTKGVSSVVDELSVVPEPATAPTTGIGEPATEGGAGDVVVTDAGITSAVKVKLLADPDVAGLRIDVDTRDRVVTLTGTVATQAEKSEALQLARQVKNVVDVTDKLTVKHRQ
jgi:hyperosmotically inducible protein